jgi:hypothetical protein
MNKFSEHLPFRQMADYLEGDLPLDKRVDLEAHVAGCSHCSDELTRLEDILELMRTDDNQDAPSSVINRAVDLFRSRTVLVPTSTGLRRRVLAVLHFDSARLGPAFGMRSGRPRARQFLFSSNMNEIDLRIEPTGQAWTVSGQVLGESTTGGVAVLQGVEGTSEAALNEMSEFTLSPVQTGTYKLILNLTDLDVEIDEIRIGT